MTKRRSIIALFLAVAILALGVGYATLTDTLTVKGTINSPAFDKNVYFSAKSVTTTNADGAAITADCVLSAPTDNEGNDKATIEITGGFDAQDDQVKVVLTIKNDNAFAVKITKLDFTNVNNTSNITVTHEGVTEGETVLGAKDSGTDTATLTIIITLTAVPTSEITDGFTITMTAVGQNATATP